MSPFIPRITLRFTDPTTADYVRRTAEERGMSQQALVRRAIGIMQAFEAMVDDGLYIGATKNRDNLELIIVAPR